MIQSIVTFYVPKHVGHYLLFYSAEFTKRTEVHVKFSQTSLIFILFSEAFNRGDGMNIHRSKLGPMFDTADWNLSRAYDTKLLVQN